MNTYQPKPEHKFTFGLWTVGNTGEIHLENPSARGYRRWKLCTFWRKLEPTGLISTTMTWFPFTPLLPRGMRLSRILSTPWMRPAFACPWRLPIYLRTRSSRTAHSPQMMPKVRAFALQKTLKPIDLGVELGAKVYVFWGGREGVESDATKDPVESIKRFREAMNFFCDYALDQKYDLKFALEAKPNEPRVISSSLPPGRILVSLKRSIIPRWWESTLN